MRSVDTFNGHVKDKDRGLVRVIGRHRQDVALTGKERIAEAKLAQDCTALYNRITAICTVAEKQTADHYMHSHDLLNLEKMAARMKV
jgi:hypothetical protein